MAGQVLSQADILLLKSYAGANDAVSYYEFLIEKGYDYGYLALGVVKGDTLAGSSAKLYAEMVAADVGVTLSESEWQAITSELMEADFFAREQMFNANPSQPVELGWQPVLDYHVSVFDIHGLPPHAWTAYTVLTSGSDPELYDPEVTWEIMLDMGTTIPIDEIGSVFMDLLYMASDEQAALAEQMFLDYPIGTAPNPNTFGNSDWMSQNAPALYQLQILNSPEFYVQAIINKFGNDVFNFGHEILKQIDDFSTILTDLSNDIDWMMNGMDGILGDMFDIAAAGLVSVGAELAEDWAYQVTTPGVIHSANIPLADMGVGSSAMLSIADKCVETFTKLGDNALIEKVTNPDGSVSYEASWWDEPTDTGDGTINIGTLHLARGDAIRELGEQLYLVSYEPLVIDLDGDGIETLSYSEAKGNAFDLLEEYNLYANHGWVSPDDGLLAIDTNKNGLIDGLSELFGSPETSGFAELAQYDGNEDGVIDLNDAIFADLYVWRDVNSDGTSQEDEMYSLEDLGIVSLTTGDSLVSEMNNGNYVSQLGSVLYADGDQHLSADVHFTVDLTTLHRGVQPMEIA